MTRLDHRTAEAIVAGMERQAVRTGNGLVTLRAIGRVTWAYARGQSIATAMQQAAVLHDVLMGRWCGGYPGDN